MENFKPLTQDETKKLLERAKDNDEQAKNDLIQGNFPLIKSVVKKYMGRGVEYDDLYQIGCVGFLKAINNFDSAFDVKFTTYAVPMIAGEIKRFLRDDGEIKISRAIKTLSMKAKAFMDSYKKEHYAEPTINQIAEHFCVDPEEVVYALDSVRPMVSIYEKIDESSGNSANLIDKIIVEDNSDNLIDKLLLRTSIDELEDREKKVIILRYFRGKTQSEVAAILGVSQVQVSRIESKILETLKRKLK